jgi:PleD family two-component response regulator
MTYSPPPRTRILLCVVPQTVERLTRILSGHELIFATNRPEAARHLENDRFGMVVVGVHFDDAQIFTLISDIRLHARYRKVPILVVHSPGAYDLTEVAIEAIDRAVLALTANGFLSFDHFDDDAEGDARVRRVVDYLILINGDLHHIARRTGDPGVVRMVERRRPSQESAESPSPVRQ